MQTSGRRRLETEARIVSRMSQQNHRTDTEIATGGKAFTHQGRADPFPLLRRRHGQRGQAQQRRCRRIVQGDGGEEHMPDDFTPELGHQR